MNPSAWGKGMYSSSYICNDGCTAEFLSSFQPDLVPSNSDGAGDSVALNKDSENIKNLTERPYCSSVDAEPSWICSSQLELSPSRDTDNLSTKRHPSPASSSCGHHDWNSGHQAKRARVENIIKGMTSTPAMRYADVMTNQNERLDGVQESERLRELPLHHEGHGFGSASHSQMTRKHLESQQQHLSQVRTKFNYFIAEIHTPDSGNREKHPTCNNCPETCQRDVCTDAFSEFESSSNRKDQGWKKLKLINYSQTKPERIKLMADVLKYELSRAVSRSVDSIFKSMPLLQASPNDDSSPQSPVCKDNTVRLSYYGNVKEQVEDVQTEALSLVVQKPRLKRGDKFILQSGSRDDSSLHEEKPLLKNDNPACQSALRCSDADQTKFEMFDAHWNSVKVRSKVNSRTARNLPVDPMPLQSLCLPHAKTESDGLLKNNFYMMNVSFTCFYSDVI